MKAKDIVKILNKKYHIYDVDYALIIGSGLNEAVPELENITIIPYEKLRMPKSKVKGHMGRFVFGTYEGKKVVLVSRMHFYESGDLKKVRLPYEILHGLNCKTVMLLTSCGGVNKTFRVGDIMLIRDHINLTGENPLIGIDPLEFVAMSNAYDREIYSKMLKVAKENNIDVREGTHIQLTGPSYETNAEVDFIRTIGADTVSMSTALDCIMCNYFKMKVCGIASVVNVFDEGNTEELTHDEVLANAKKMSEKIKTIICGLIKE